MPGPLFLKLLKMSHVLFSEHFLLPVLTEGKIQYVFLPWGTWRINLAFSISDTRHLLSHMYSHLYLAKPTVSIGCTFTSFMRKNTKCMKVTRPSWKKVGKVWGWGGGRKKNQPKNWSYPWNYCWVWGNITANKYFREDTKMTTHHTSCSEGMQEKCWSQLLCLSISAQSGHWLRVLLQWRALQHSLLYLRQRFRETSQNKNLISK